LEEFSDGNRIETALQIFVNDIDIYREIAKVEDLGWEEKYDDDRDVPSFHCNFDNEEVAIYELSQRLGPQCRDWFCSLESCIYEMELAFVYDMY
jgi:hypothetical protein